MTRDRAGFSWYVLAEGGFRDVQDVAWTGERDDARKDRPVRAEQQSVADLEVDDEIESGSAVAPRTRRGTRAIWRRRDGLCERALLGSKEINNPARTDGEKADEEEQSKSTHGDFCFTPFERTQCGLRALGHRLRHSAARHPRRAVSQTLANQQRAGTRRLSSMAVTD